MLQKPTCWALGLPANTPRHYAFNLPDGGRRAFIERVYTSLNAAGAALPSDKFDAVVNESALVRTANLPQFHAATRSSHPPPFFFLCVFFFFWGTREAHLCIFIYADRCMLHSDNPSKVFKLNADVYSEEPMMLDAMVGSLNVLKGYASS